MVLDDALQQVKSGLGGQVKQQVIGAKKPVGKSIGFLKQINPFENDKKEQSGETPVVDAGQVNKADEDVVRGLYGIEQPQQQPKTAGAEDKDKLQSEETKKLLEDQLKNQLHQEYYQKLLNPEKRPEEAQEDQERAADRVERLHQEDLQKKQKKEEEKKPIAVDRAETARERKSAGAG